jgi:hypothetical protein
MALVREGRAARAELERALALDADFPSAPDARRTLQSLAY